MSGTADVIIIGLGAIGSANLYQLARRGARVLGFDRFHPPHDRGSSHGETRITRQAIGEGEHYVPLALRSHAIWRDLESETGERLLLACGFAAIDSSGGTSILHGKVGFVERTEEIARRFGIAHEVLSPAEMCRRYPALKLRGDERVYFEPGGGLVYPERCISAQLARARALGARIRTGEAVTAIESGPHGASVTTSLGVYTAGQVVVAAGGWTPALIGAPMGSMRLLRQTLHWFAPEQPEVYQSERFPTFIWTHGARAQDSFYGFPIAPGTTKGVKLATEQYSVAIDAPEALDRAVALGEAHALWEDHVAGRLHGLSKSALKSIACFYTNAPDGDFVVGYRPNCDRLLVVSACSGHGFKHSAGLGEHVARLIVGEESANAEFSLARATLDGSRTDIPARGRARNRHDSAKKPSQRHAPDIQG